jgi:hypothetical protein
VSPDAAILAAARSIRNPDLFACRPLLKTFKWLAKAGDQVRHGAEPFDIPRHG